MSSGVLASARRSTQFHRNGSKYLSPAEQAIDWSIIKRDGTVQLFSVSKVKEALRKCFVLGMKRHESSADTSIAILLPSILNVLANHDGDLTVEYVQRTVIQQLWAAGDFEAAEHYTIYREEHRKLRDQQRLDPEAARMIQDDAKHFPTPLQAYQFYSKFARWNDETRRRDTWKECNQRVFNWFETLPAYGLLTQQETDWLFDSMYTMAASPAMRVVQMAGPALERCHVGAYNCTYSEIVDLRSFSELLYILMQGCGAGFSVEYECISELPRVKKQKKNGSAVVHKFTIADNTEGWCEALRFGLERWFDGEDVEYDYSLIRKKGERLRTKGGRASGPDPLRDLLNFTRRVVMGAQGRRLTDLEVHDICCMIGKIVQVGGVRRASCISLSDLDSSTMRDAKHGNWWEHNRQRSMANNSAVYDEKPPLEVFMTEWLGLLKSRSGERGIFNREAAEYAKPARRQSTRWGVNPCAEILLRHCQMCNLSIAIIRGNETREELADKVMAATYFGVLQSTATTFRYLRDEWRQNCEEERLIGVDMMGHLDHPLLRPGAANREELVTYLKDVVADTAKGLAKRFGINYSAANTCLKPGGDSSVFFNTTSLAPYYSEYQIRRTRESADSPVALLLKEQGVPWDVAPEDPALIAFAWPKHNKEGCITRDDMTAIQQLENWLLWKTHWCEHSASTTIYVKEHEWFAVGDWVWSHFDQITGLSFLPWDNGSYSIAPNEAISAEQYQTAMKTFPTIDWSRLCLYEDDDCTNASSTPACVGNSCSM